MASETASAASAVQHMHQQYHRPLPPSTSNVASKEARSKTDRARGKPGTAIQGPREMKPAPSAKRSSSLRKTSTDDDTASTDDAASVAGASDTADSRSFAHRLLVQGDHHLLRDIDRPPPGDPAQLRPRRSSLLSLGKADRRDAERRTSRVVSEGVGSTDSVLVSRKRSQYFEELFSARDPDGAASARDRVLASAPVLADVRTNVQVTDEYTVITDLVAHLAARYGRPLSAVAVTLQHGQCLCLGGSFAGAYTMTVHALPSQLQPTTNKRNAALIQKHMEASLGVPPTRGHLQFVPVPEANLAYAGNTAAGHLDDLARTSASSSVSGTTLTNGSASPTRSSGDTPAQPAGGPGSRKKTPRKLSVKGLASFRSPSVSPEKAADKARQRQRSQSASAAQRGAISADNQSTLNGLSAASQGAAQPASSSSSNTAAPTLPVILERSLKEGLHEDAHTKTLPLRPADDSPPPTAGQLPVSPFAAYGNPGGTAQQRPLVARSAASRPSSAVAVGTHANTLASTVSDTGIAGRQPSRRVHRTKSFVATLFGRSPSTAGTPSKIAED